MMNAAFKALGDLTSPDFRNVLLKSVGLAILLFVLLSALVQGLFWFLALTPWAWLDAVLAIGVMFSMLASFFFLMAPVTSLFAGLYLDHIADRVEAKHYPQAQGQALSITKALITGLQFGALVLVVNVLALPLVLTGVGAIILVVINAYLLSRQYFEMAAMRVMPVDEAKDLRAANAVTVFLAGFLPALMALIPFVSLVVPLFATSYFIHLFRQVKA